jgi:hypothetical protein
VITELEMLVGWTAEAIIAEIDYPNLTPEHLRRAAELLENIADVLAIREAKPSLSSSPVDDGLAIPDFLNRTREAAP